MDVTDTIDHGVAAALPTGVKLLFHRLSKEEKDPATTVIHRYLRETYAVAFEHIHVAVAVAYSTTLPDEGLSICE